MQTYTYVRPKTLREALDILIEYKERAAILNGGTDLVVQLRENLRYPEVVVDIKGIPELHELRIDGNEVFIGSCVLLSEMGTHDYLVKHVPFLTDAGNSVGSVQVRNRATSVGNLCNASPLADTSTPMLALDATMHIYGEDGIRQVALKDFFVFVRKTVLKPTDIVTGISFTVPSDIQGVFQKTARRSKVDLSTVCATVARTEGKYRIAFGSVAPTPIRLYKTEEYFNTHPLTEETIEIGSKMAREEVKPIDDVRASAEYRKHIVEISILRAMNQLRG